MQLSSHYRYVGLYRDPTLRSYAHGIRRKFGGLTKQRLNFLRRCASMATERPLRSAMVVLLLVSALVLTSVLLASSAHAQTVVATVTVVKDPEAVAYDSAKGEVFVTIYDER